MDRLTRSRETERTSDLNMLQMYRVELEEQRWTDIPKSVRRNLKGSGLIKVYYGKGSDRVRIAIIYRKK